MSDAYKYLGDFSATPPQYSRSMSCHDCKVSWAGCWDNFECPICRKGDIPMPNMPLEFLTNTTDK